MFFKKRRPHEKERVDGELKLAREYELWKRELKPRNRKDEELQMDASVITCIQSALDDLMKSKLTSDSQELIFELRNLKIFVLCARKLGNDQSLRPLFVWVEDVVGGKAKEIAAGDYSFQIESLVEEVHDWYITIFDHMRALPSSSLMVSEVLKLLNCILENLVDICHLRSSKFSFEELQEQMKFLICIIEFAAQIRTLEAGSREYLTAHAEAVAVNAAYLIFTCRIDKFDKGMEFKVSSLLQQIKPVDPQVYEIYTQVLRSFKCSIPSLAPTRGMDEMKSFLSSLTTNLSGILSLNTFHLVPIKYQLQDLDAGLQSLTTVLDRSHPPYSLDVKRKGDIGAVICDAGVLICSLYQTEVDLGLLQILPGSIKIIRANFGERDPVVQPLFSFQRSYELGFIDVLSENLMELISCGAEPTAASCLQTIQEKLVYLRHLLGENVELCDELQALWVHVMEVAYKINFLVDYLKVGDLPYSFLPLFDSTMIDIRSIKADVLKVFCDKRKEITVNEVTWTSSSHQMQTLRTPTITNEMVGHHEDERLILDQLLGGSKHLRIISIVGMPGIGKTTLATKVYNNPSISLHFSVRAWCPISQEVDKMKVFSELLNQIVPRDRSDRTAEQLEEELRSRLDSEKYLILLDDVLDIKAWDTLKNSFPDNNNTSRIILTSRVHHIAPDDMLVGDKPHILCELSRDESLELLLMKSLVGLRGWQPTLWDLSMQIVDICRGFPEVIVSAARLLVTTDPGCWKEILDDLRPGILSSELCMSTLDLSYRHLPPYLRSCFLCFATFPKDQDVSVWRLLCLWNAEGFVQNDKTRSPEDVAEEYLEVLIRRELIVVAKRRSNGGIKACRVQGLVHEFCIGKAKAEKFYHFVNWYDVLSAFNNQQDSLRLSIISKLEHFKEPKLVCHQAISLAFNPSQQIKREEEEEEEEELFQDISFLTYTFKLLRVLDLEQINAGNVFPCEIELLDQLVFLAIRGKMGDIPSCIDSLSNLETLIVDSGENILSLPASLWNLLNLRYLYIRSSRSSGGGRLPITNLEGSSAINRLERFSGAVIPSWSSMERLMKNFPNIRKLKCRQDKDDAENLQETVALNFLCQLHSLDLSSSDAFQFKFSFPANLKKLTLSGFHLLARKISTIGKMPNLEVLKLLNVSFARDTWEIEEGEFLKLRVLKLHSPGLVWWRARNEDLEIFKGLENFKRLILDGCQALEKIPEVLEEILTLEVIEVYNCSMTVVKLVKHIQDAQMDLGNGDIKVSI